MEHNPLREKILAVLSEARASGITDDTELAQAVTSALNPPAPTTGIDSYLTLHRGRVMNAMRGFIRVCKSGGMENSEAITVKANVSTAVDLGYFDNPVAYLPIESVPKDGTMVRLLASHPHFTTEDDSKAFWTMGFNTDEGWKVVGWDWSSDEFVTCQPILLGWLPMEPIYGLHHRLYANRDPGDYVPDQIKDRNGQVALALCAVCDKAESELDGPCIVNRTE